MIRLRNINLSDSDNKKYIGLRRICCVIRDNICINPHIALLGKELGIEKDISKSGIKEAVKRLSQRLPYFTTIKYPNVNNSYFTEVKIPVKLTPTTYKQIYLVELETDMIRLLESLINCKTNLNVPLRKNMYVRLTASGEIYELGSRPFPKDLISMSIDMILLKYTTSEFYFLKTLQNRQYQIIPVLENICNTENRELGLIFTIGNLCEYDVLAYESYLDSRATYVFIVRKGLCEKAIQKIKSYFQSDINNKRSLIKKVSKPYISRANGFIKVIKISHNSDWASNIKSCIQ